MLPLAQGACTAVGGNMVTDAFGVVAMVAMTPLITIQILGIFYKIKTKKLDTDTAAEETDIAASTADDDIIRLDSGREE